MVNCDRLPPFLEFLRTFCGLTEINFAPCSYDCRVTQSAIKRRPSDVLAAHRDEVLSIARARGACNMRVFGSVARGEDGPASDIDMIADFPVGTSLLTVIGLEQALRDLLGVPVDLGPADALRKDMRDRVLAEARPL